MTPVFLVVIGMVIGSTVPLVLSRNEREHVRYSVILAQMPQ